MQIQEDPAHIDSEDMDALVEALARAGTEAEPTEQREVLKAAWWVLVLYWIGAEQATVGFISQLKTVGSWIGRQYRFYAFDWGARPLIFGGRGRLGQETPPACSSTLRR